MVLSERAQAVLKWLQSNGPAVLPEIAAGTGLTVSKARYSLQTVRDAGHAFVQGYRKAPCGDGIERKSAVFAAGEGIDAKPPQKFGPKPWQELDFQGTLHLQEIYRDWTAFRAHQEYVCEDDDDTEESSPTLAVVP